MGAELGTDRLAFERRLEGGLGCTMDVLVSGGRRFVLRRYGPWRDKGSGAATDEAVALRVASMAGVPVPEPVWVDDGGIFEREAIVISYIEGEPDLTPTEPESWARQLAHALARIHTADPAGRHFRPQDPGVDVDEVPARVAEHPLGKAVWEAQRQELSRLGPQPRVFLHADFWPGNTLWRNGELVAVVDWEEPSVGDPMSDVAYCLTDLAYAGLDVGESFVDAYVAASGRSTEALRHWRLVALMRPMPDIAQWVPAWNAMGSAITADLARARHLALIEELLG